MDSEEIQQIIAMKKREHYLSMHEHKVWQGKDGFWYTYLPDEKRGKRLLRKTYQSTLYDSIVDYYEKQANEPTFIPVYNMWIKEKISYNEIRESTYSKYQTDFQRFFPEDEDFCNIKLKDMNDSILELFIKRTIKRCKLTKKTVGGLKIILSGVFKYAKREGYTSYSISTFFKDLYLNDNIFEKKKSVTTKEQVFDSAETNRLISYLWKNKSIHNLGLILMFETGIRVGELVALKWDNIKTNSISINATEVCYKDESIGKKVFRIQDIPKTESGSREVFLPDTAKNTIEEIRKLNSNEEFLFTKNGKRIISIRMNYYLQKACDAIGIPRRSTHKIRKTYASTLLRNKVDDQLVKEQLGHSDVQTTRQYYYFITDTDEDNRNIINNVIPY